MGSLRAKNASEKFSSLGTFKGGIFFIFSLGGEGLGGQYFGRRQTLLCTLHMYVLCGYIDRHYYQLQLHGNGR
jgi:hypothetical protein